MLNIETLSKIYSPIHFNMGTDVEVTFSHLQFIPTRAVVFGKVVELVYYYKNAFGINFS